MKHSLKDRSGYLIIDHSESPGIRPEDIPPELRNSTPAVGAGAIYERDVQLCSHCGSQVILNPLRERPRGYCAKCDHYICDNPICNKECQPLARLLEQVDNQIQKNPNEPVIILTDN